MNLAIKIYDFLRMHRRLMWGALIALTAIMLLLLLRITLKEDISDFLPLAGEKREALGVYQQIAGGDRVVAIIQCKDSTQVDPDLLVEATDAFAERALAADTANMLLECTAEIGMEEREMLMEEVYAHLPLLMTQADFERADSILSDPDAVAKGVAESRERLMLPGGGLMADVISYDPLGLFTPVLNRLQTLNVGGYELYDGHILDAPQQHAFVIMRSRFGGQETHHNTQLIAMLESVGQQLENNYPQISVHLTGGPAIAVGNAQQIKTDSITSVITAVVLIAALLIVSIRRLRHIGLIAVAIAWGWLFALAGLSLVHSEISLIVVGISSVILGIAVNYPLHMVTHLSHTPSVRTTLHDIVVPLVVGNVTTVGAFMALVPLSALALRDLGIFSALLLVGTIFFVIIFMPHLLGSSPATEVAPAEEEASAIRLAKHSRGRWVLPLLLSLITIALGWRSLYTQFDADIRHINFMTDEQRADIEYFSKMIDGASKHSVKYYLVYAAPTTDSALDRALSDSALLHSLASRYGEKVTLATEFMTSQRVQQERLRRWREFIAAHSAQLLQQVAEEGRAAGFAGDAFSGFCEILQADYTPEPIERLPAFSRILSGSMARTSEGDACVVSCIDAPERMQQEVARLIEEEGHASFAFDVGSMNAAITDSLASNFNYIGWACGAIVFVFLWLSMGRIELAIIAFVPMAVSWVWILGAMEVLDIRFNIVNIILATFIFGQGDDYTIFITEGCIYEYATRRRMLHSFRRSIVVSALIMFIGIGALIVARHPALHSLAEVTIVGMAVVVMMAWVVPPYLFRWLVMSHGQVRRRPISLRLLSSRENGEQGVRGLIPLVRDRYLYKGASVQYAVDRALRTPEIITQRVESHAAERNLTFYNDKYGVEALLTALAYPDKQITACFADADECAIARWSAHGIVNNINFIHNNHEDDRK